MSNLFFAEDFLFDSHCHLDDKQFDTDREACIRRAITAGVPAVIDVGVDVASSESAVEIAGRFPGTVVAAVGIDPDVMTFGSEIYDANINLEVAMNTIRLLAVNNPDVVIGLGETGIDDFKSAQALERGELTLAQYNEIKVAQERLFEMHLVLAEETGLPLTIHSRGAEQRCLEIVRSFPKARGVFHSFTAGYDMAKQVVDAGWGLGVNGIITFRNATDVRDMYARILGNISADWTPADFYRRGVYFETDAPFLSPEGKRGERNEPANIADIYSFMISA